jgi:hypothetical protein
MDTFALIVVGYCALGFGCLWLSVWLAARRIRRLVFRAAIHAAIFSVWFSPGAVAGQGGAVPAPLWISFVGELSQYHNAAVEDAERRHDFPNQDPPDRLPLQFWWYSIGIELMIFVIVWVLAFLVTLGLGAIYRRWQARISAA